MNGGDEYVSSACASPEDLSTSAFVLLRIVSFRMMQRCGTSSWSDLVLLFVNFVRYWVNKTSKEYGQVSSVMEDLGKILTNIVSAEVCAKK